MNFEIIKERVRGFEPVDDPNILMPRRATKFSAGYDIYNNTGETITILPGELSDKIPTKIKSYMLSDEFLMIVPRSGHGFKYSVRLATTMGIIDSDYYNNENNQGEIFIKFHNQGSQTLIIKPGEAFAQGIFQKYFTTDDDDLTVGGERTGGFGSTSK